MTINLQEIVRAIEALNAARELLSDGGTPQQRGRAAAACTIASSALRSALCTTQVSLTEH